MLFLDIARHLFFYSHYEVFLLFVWGFLPSLNLTHFITPSGIVFIGLINYVFMKKMEIIHMFRMKTNKLGGFLLHGCVFVPSSPLSSAELVAFSAINCFKTTDQKKPKTNPNPIASAFFWITRFG